MTAIALALLFAACGSFELREVQNADTLYFGTNKPGGVVSDAEWRAFVDEVITPRFPGFTEWVADGHWKREHEMTHVVQIVHPPRWSHDEAVHEIIATYKARFHQEAVLWVRGRVMILAP